MSRRAAEPSSADSLAARLRELAILFFKLGTIAFGGPAAHIALFETEVVGKRRWIDRQQFLDLLGAANLIPGPTSTETAISIGYARGGWPGLCVAGACFIIPAALITGAFAWAYVRFGSLPQAAAILSGIKPAVLAVIAIAISRLGKTAVKDFGLAVLGVLALAAFFFGLNAAAILFGGGLLGMLARRVTKLRATTALVLAPLFPSSSIVFVSSTTTPPSLGGIALFFLKLGAVLYGGGYVLLAFLEQGLVHQHAWLTQQQLLDAVAIGQFTPGPVFSTATFIGYLLGGVPGAAVATVGIFLPSFFYVGLLAPVLFRLRESAWIAAFMDSVNVCAVALMFAVTFRLGTDALHGWTAWLIALLSLGILLRWKLSPAWIVLGGGLAGLMLAAAHVR